MAFHKRKFPLVSFSCGGDPRDPAVVLDEDGAKAEDEVVVSAPWRRARIDDMAGAMGQAYADGKAVGTDMPPHRPASGLDR